MISASVKACKAGPLPAQLRLWSSTLLRKSVLLGTLIAFVLQGYAVQSHFHFAPSRGPGTIVAKLAVTDAAAASASQQRSPSNDPELCAICQEFLHAGQYLTPAPALALLVTAVIVPLTIRRDTPVAMPPVSHNWRGRAPPEA